MVSKKAPGETPRPIVPFGVLLLAGLVAVLAESILLTALPYLTSRYERQFERAEFILREPYIVTREEDSLHMLPPSIGMKYRRQVLINQSDPSVKLYSSLLTLDQSAKLETLRKSPVSERTILQVLDLSYEGTAADRQLEDFLVQAAAKGQLAANAWSVYDSVYRNYFLTGSRSQYAGLVEDAKRSYRRFLDLGRILARDTYLSDDLKVQRQLNRASVRLKILAPKHAFNAESMRRIQRGSAREMKAGIDFPDMKLAALSRFNAASVLWHAEENPGEAAALLRNNLQKCGPLSFECRFLLAKMFNGLADKAGRAADSGNSMPARRSEYIHDAAKLLDDLVRELPDTHPLLDDVYFHRAIVARCRGDTPLALKELEQLRSRCTDTDKAWAVNEYQKQWSAPSSYDARAYEPDCGR